MFQTQLRQTYLAAAIMATVISGFLGFGIAFGANLSCTNHYSCTMDWCPAACDRPTIGFAANSLTQIGLFIWLVAGASNQRFRPPDWSLVAATNLSVLVLAMSGLLTASWR
jgi:hypothetical protein